MTRKPVRQLVIGKDIGNFRPHPERKNRLADIAPGREPSGDSDAGSRTSGQLGYLIAIARGAGSLPRRGFVDHEKKRVPDASLMIRSIDAGTDTSTVYMKVANAMVRMVRIVRRGLVAQVAFDQLDPVEHWFASDRTQRVDYTRPGGSPRRQQSTDCANQHARDEPG